MLFFMAKPSALVILYGSCSWKNIHGEHKWHSILKYNYCTACANIVHTSNLRIYKPDVPGFFHSDPAMHSACPEKDSISACPEKDSIPNQPIL
jgi:hypothetical protein